MGSHGISSIFQSNDSTLVELSCRKRKAEKSMFEEYEDTTDKESKYLDMYIDKTTLSDNPIAILES